MWVQGLQGPEGSDLQLELQPVVKYHVGAGSFESDLCSETLFLALFRQAQTQPRQTALSASSSEEGDKIPVEYHHTRFFCWLVGWLVFETISMQSVLIENFPFPCLSIFSARIPSAYHQP